MSDRHEQLHFWISKILGLSTYQLQLASSDASFRHYFRLTQNGHSWIVMDAPPERENTAPYIDIERRLYAASVNVPQILERDIENGFLLLTDLGDKQYLAELNETTVEALYDDALAALLTIQQRTDTSGLPPYSARLLLDEMALFRDWLLGRHLGLELSSAQLKDLGAVFELLKENALQQPQVFVHRDYHSRNLMMTEEHNPGILDFQDAVYGPITYDLVSLLKDCYIKWPRDNINTWALDFYYRLDLAGTDETTFLRWFDLMGVQRHLKASGIFARLFHRDGKNGYLADIPRTLSYIMDLQSQYPELAMLVELIGTKVLPRLKEANTACVP